MNTTELNKTLSDEIFKLRAGKAKPERVNAITRAASQIIAAARLELAYIKIVGAPQAILPFFDNGDRRNARRLPALTNGTKATNVSPIERGKRRKRAA